MWEPDARAHSLIDPVEATPDEAHVLFPRHQQRDFAGTHFLLTHLCSHGSNAETANYS